MQNKNKEYKFIEHGHSVKGVHKVISKQLGKGREKKTQKQC